MAFRIFSLTRKITILYVVIRIGFYLFVISIPKDHTTIVREIYVIFTNTINLSENKLKANIF